MLCLYFTICYYYFTGSTEDKKSGMNHFDKLEVNYVQQLVKLWGLGQLFCDVTLAEESIQNLINSDEQFDLLIIDAFFVDCYLGFAHKFKTPVIQFCGFGGTEVIGDLVGNPSPYSYVPDPFSEFSDRMTFSERALNALGHIFQKLAKNYFIEIEDEIMRKHFHDPKMPSIWELEKSTALVLVNHHFSISYPRPLVPNFVQVGGLHIKPPKKLPAVSVI